ncbi:hypothetical protein EZH24_01435 [Brachyspira catarrhinii]|uniref:Lipoprotein n=2 Tax=Brachyspira catarrhinii TaxID=2528966 RepID=A0ABY2TTV7_9SPIR|nr:hypothetical protein EZH24_01435 [Brachyspira catarrhinii]
MRKLKKLFLALSVLLLISCAVNVKMVEDDFYGEKSYHYQTSYMSVGDIEFRFTATKNPAVITLEAQYVKYEAFTVSKGDKIVLRFNDDTFVNLNYINDMPSVSSYYSSYSFNSYWGVSVPINSYTINAAARINNDIGTLTAIRIENSGGFKNLDVSKSFANTFQKAYNDIKNKINE